MFTRRMSPPWRIITSLMLWGAFSRMARWMTTRSLDSRPWRARASRSCVGGPPGWTR